MKKVLLLLLLLPFIAYSDSTASVEFERTSQQYASATTPLGINGTDITVSFWVNFESLPSSGEQHRLFITQNTDASVSYLVMYYNNGGTKELWFTRGRMNVGYDTASYAVDFTTSTWYHISARYNGTNIELFIDGVSVAGPTSASGSGTGGADGTAIGGADSTETGVFTIDTGKLLDGFIDEVLVYNDDKSDAVILALSDTPCSYNETSLIARWPLESDFTDSVASYDLTGANAPTFTGSSAFSCGSESGSAQGTATTSEVSTGAILVNGFLSIVFGLAIIIFLLMLFVSGYLYNNLIKPIYDR